MLIKRKYRYGIEGKNENGDVVFPFMYVRLHERPAFPYMAVATEDGDKFVKVSGEIAIDQDFDNKEEAETFIAKSSTIKSVELRCLDGCGDVVEQWKFENAIVKAYQADEGMVEWHIAYSESEYYVNPIHKCNAKLPTIS